ncbi:MAG: hypothetical protein WKF84_08960 [Pyrinomonadaceae bacterium]
MRFLIVAAAPLMLWMVLTGNGQATDKTESGTQVTAISPSLKEPETVDFLMEKDLSGFELIGRFLKLPDDRLQLKGPCLAKQRAIKDALASFESSRLELEKETGAMRNWSRD